jgi:hypothetical protein
MSDTFNAQQINEMFGAALDGGTDVMEKLGEATGLYIQDKLRENSFARKILSPQTVTAAELTRNETDEGLSYIDDIEPNSVAMAVNWRGEPNKTYVEGKRYKINLSTISSERIQKSEQELRSYKMPLVKVIEQNIVKDIQEQVDARFMLHVKAGLFLACVHRYNELLGRSELLAGNVTGGRNFKNEAELYCWLYAHDKYTGLGTSTPGNAKGQEVDASDTTTSGLTSRQAYHTNLILGDQTYFNRNVVKELAKVMASRQLKLKTILMHESDFADVLAWSETDAGLKITEEIVVEGYKYVTIGGIQYVTTVRDNPDIVAPGQIFGFPAQAFLGRFLSLENTKFFMKKEGRFITMEAWEDIGIGFGNVKGIACYLLVNASITIPAKWVTSAGVANTTSGGNGNAGGYWSGTQDLGNLGGAYFRIKNIDPAGATLTDAEIEAISGYGTDFSE